MHIAQIMLVEADNHDSAIQITSEKLLEDGITPQWSDWHGSLDSGLAGRWTGAVFGTSHPDEVMRYADDSELAEKVLKDFLGQRKEEMTYAVKQLGENFNLLSAVENYDPLVVPDTQEKSYWDNQMMFWHAKSIVSTLSDEWTHSSGVFDIEECTAKLTYFRERLNDPERKDKQFLVVVDFHF
jgi:hypothetical protein